MKFSILSWFICRCENNNFPWNFLRLSLHPVRPLPHPIGMWIHFILLWITCPFVFFSVMKPYTHIIATKFTCHHRTHSPHWQHEMPFSQQHKFPSATMNQYTPPPSIPRSPLTWYWSENCFTPFAIWTLAGEHIRVHERRKQWTTNGQNIKIAWPLRCSFIWPERP